MVVIISLNIIEFYFYYPHSRVIFSVSGRLCVCLSVNTLIPNR